mmetsp:Transcript_23809/g.44246  ORF Transcript_23809/g.44246 Transcript_23809/m.44246 type:complete len:251 (+) Transcript_23809:138-890(+)
MIFKNEECRVIDDSLILLLDANSESVFPDAAFISLDCEATIDKSLVELPCCHVSDFVRLFIPRIFARFVGAHVLIKNVSSVIVDGESALLVLASILGIIAVKQDTSTSMAGSCNVPNLLTCLINLRFNTGLIMHATDQDDIPFATLKLAWVAEFDAVPFNHFGAVLCIYSIKGLFKILLDLLSLFLSVHRDNTQSQHLTVLISIRRLFNVIHKVPDNFSGFCFIYVIFPLSFFNMHVAHCRLSCGWFECS